MAGVEPFLIPFTILCDSQEKAPYRFMDMQADAALKNRDLIIPVEWAHLKTGDYSIKGWSKHVTIERKSINDLFSTLGQHRDRFEREHVRMASMGAGNTCVIIEANWNQILNHPPRRSRLLPKVVFRTFLSWSQKYAVPWIALEDRRLAEVATFRFLECWWNRIQEELARKSKTCGRCGMPLSSKRSIERGAGHICAKYGLERKNANDHRSPEASRPGRSRN